MWFLPLYIYIIPRVKGDVNRKLGRMRGGFRERDNCSALMADMEKCG
jgi:hypothetical protein